MSRPSAPDVCSNVIPCSDKSWHQAIQARNSQGAALDSVCVFLDFLTGISLLRQSLIVNSVPGDTAMHAACLRDMQGLHNVTLVGC